MIICLAAVIAGTILAIWSPVVQFALVLVTISLAGALVAILCQAPTIQVGIWTLLLFFSAQVGYGAGVAILTAVRAMKGRGNAPGLPGASAMRSDPIYSANSSVAARRYRDPRTIERVDS